jgi:type II secretory ATPase GspE/PulE/Tfp pilus assembly ATPase PilB-like protein
MALTDDQLLDSGIRTGLIDAKVIEKLRVTARRQRTSIMTMVLAHYRFPSSALYRAVAQQQRVEYIDISYCDVERDLLKKIPNSIVRRKLVLPMLSDGKVKLIVSDPSDRTSIDLAQRMMGKVLPLAMADNQQLQRRISHLLPANEANATSISEDDTDVVALLDDILREAYLNRASDVHFITEKLGLRVRFRVDGKLRDHPVDANSAIASGMISRIKVLSNLDISEQRQPQDGGFTYKLAAPINQEFSIRVATAPTRLGERITMRLLGQESGGLTLHDLGMLDTDLERFRSAIHNPYGMILLTGPTGSGKSTTLFAALQEINDPAVNIMTVENPIEYVIEGVSQVQTGHKVSFADALRSFLRHDPDVLMVGEIRDHETADVAVKAAMTGHLVFSTLHTNNAVSAVTRLIDIGCEPFLIGSTMTAVIAQRLVRRLCTECRSKRSVTDKEREAMAIDSVEYIYDAVGCAVCQGTGFRGRVGLYETLWFNEKLARLVARGADEEVIETEASKTNDLQFMWQDGCNKVVLGMTTLNEVKDVAVRKLSHEEAVA